MLKFIVILVQIFNSRMKKLLLTVALNIVFALAAFATSDIPIAKGHVHDFANKLNQPQKDTLNAMLKMYFKRTTAKIAVVIEEDSKDDPFDRSLKYARTWQVGTKDSNNGIVFYINVNQRKAFVQVANKLQGVLPDGKTGEILRTYWVPYAKIDNYYKGIITTVSAFMSVVEGKEPPKVELMDQAPAPKEDNGFQIPFFIHLILWIIIAIQIYSLRTDLRGAKKLNQVEKGELIL